MKELLGNPYVRIALGAILSTYLAPKILNKFVYGEKGVILDDDPNRASKESIQDAAAIGITSAVTAGVFVVLGMAAGKSTVAAAAAT